MSTLLFVVGTLADLTQCPKLRVIDISPTIAEAIRRTHNGKTQPPSYTVFPLTLTLVQASRFRTCSTTPLFNPLIGSGNVGP